MAQHDIAQPRRLSLAAVSIRSLRALRQGCAHAGVAAPHPDQAADQVTRPDRRCHPGAHGIDLPLLRCSEESVQEKIIGDDVRETIEAAAALCRQYDYTPAEQRIPEYRQAGVDCEIGTDGSRAAADIKFSSCGNSQYA